jgi:hypothetical protein
MTAPLELPSEPSLYSGSVASDGDVVRCRINPAIAGRELLMSKQIKRMLLASMVASGLVAVTSIVDMIIGIPYSRMMVFDILFLISAAIVIYMGYETLKEST